MNKARNHITVYEHQSVKLGDSSNKNALNETTLEALQKFYGEKGVPYFDLIHKGVRFKEFVGVLQVGETLIEVLPKADKPNENGSTQDHWRKVLIGMLKAVHGFDVQAPSSSALKLKSNTILDLYFEYFVSELEYLMHTGLVKKYRKNLGNVNALKGSLQFGKHLQYNLVHQERFYVKHTVYDVYHELHGVLYKTLKLLKSINTNTALHSRIGALLLYFPEMPEIKVSEKTFERLTLDRKTKSYQKALEIARLLLMQYHPDLSRGRDHVLALMFDMNVLWEKFVFVSLKKHGLQVFAQNSKSFWKPTNGPRRTIRPDIRIVIGDQTFICDTKWKVLKDNRPSMEDIRQMYAYHQYFKANKVALIYPGNMESFSGRYADIQNPLMDSDFECSLMFVPIGFGVMRWQLEIAERVKGWIEYLEASSV